MKTCALILTLLSAIIGPAVSPATAQIWQWVDRDGILTFSNSKPPEHARDATPIASTVAEDPNRDRPASRINDPERRTDTPLENHLHPDNAAASRHAEPAWPADGEIIIADGAEDEPYEPWAYDCCLRYVQPYPAYIVYDPFTDYAYTRRYSHQPYRRDRRHLRPPQYRRQHLRYYRRPYHYGFRHYDRDDFSSSYRYRSRAPRYHRYGQAPDDGRPYGIKHYGGSEGTRAYRGGRFDHGPRTGAGRMRGYRGGAGYRSRR